jgi:hypothetical protein
MAASKPHDILTVQEAGKGNQRIPDEEVLAFAIADNRAVLTIPSRSLSRTEFFGWDLVILSVQLLKQLPKQSSLLSKKLLWFSLTMEPKSMLI